MKKKLSICIEWTGELDGWRFQPSSDPYSLHWKCNESLHRRCFVVVEEDPYKDGDDFQTIWVPRWLNRSTDRAETFTKISTRPTMISGLLDGNRFFFSKIRSMKCANSPSYYNVEWMFCRSHYMEREFLCDAKPNVPAKEQFAYPE